MKLSVFAVLLTLVFLGSAVAPAVGQGVTAGYTVYVTFFYPFHFLYNLQVTIRDESNRVVGTGMSVDGSMVIIPVRTETPTFWLSAYALGYASGPLSNYLVNSPFWVVAGRSVVPVEVAGGDYWITINLNA
jgi:hypothetical protein